ncbi:MAG: hypothetical protein P4L68_05015 [Methylovirgula sp.]|nr:hypothetical protein [Methylovirgula sp.]
MVMAVVRQLGSGARPLEGAAAGGAEVGDIRIQAGRDTAGIWYRGRAEAERVRHTGVALRIRDLLRAATETHNETTYQRERARLCDELPAHMKTPVLVSVSLRRLTCKMGALFHCINQFTGFGRIRRTCATCVQQVQDGSAARITKNSPLLAASAILSAAARLSDCGAALGGEQHA